MLSTLLLFFISLSTVCSIKIFLLGGAVANNVVELSQIYTNLAIAAGRKPNPNNCEDDWGITQCPRVAVITSGKASQQTGNADYIIDEPGSLSYKSMFAYFGFTSRHISAHIDNYQRTTDTNNADGQYNLDIVRQADLIFFGGGDQSRHARTWLKDDGTLNQIMKVIRERALKDEILLAGSSAGSMIMCNPIYGSGISYGHIYFAAKQGLAVKKVIDADIGGSGICDDRHGTDSLQYRDNGAIMPGFDLVPFLVESHMGVQGRLGRIVPGIIQTKKQYGVGIDESSAIYYNNGKGTVYGRTGIFIIDLSGAIKISKQYFAINNVTISYLTSGDTFDFNTKKITPHSSKQLITKPTYEGFLDSIDIFGDNQVTKLLTRLGDQTQSMNIGRTLIPDGYPSNAPVFKLGFIRTSLMQSYWSESQKKYTIAKSAINFTYE